jgi:hypothetical protein
MLNFLELGVRGALRGRGESGGLHVDELVGEDSFDYGLMVGVVGEVHKDGIGDGVGVFSRVNLREVLVLD